MSRKNSSDVSLNPVYLSARSAIVAPERAIPVSLYALKKWLPRLGTERWSLVQLLRGLCLEAPRRPDGTKRVTTSWKFLAECLQVHEETIASWMRHQKISDDPPWRRLKPVDDYAEYLSIFIPRLRYAYETRNGKTRRVGFLLEVLMEDPVAPEDEVKLAQQVELLRYQQGQLGLEIGPAGTLLNPTITNLPDLSVGGINNVTSQQVDLPEVGQSEDEGLTGRQVNPDYSDLLPDVKQYYVGSRVDVTSDLSDLRGGKSEAIRHNVNKLKRLLDQLKQLKHQRRNYYQILEPVIAMTEDLLDDYHSTAMLYKVLKVLFPDLTDLYVAAVEEALTAYLVDESIKRGAVFVNTLRWLADEAKVDLGFKSHPSPKPASSQVTQEPVLERRLSSTELQTSLEEAIWSETLSRLQGQMTKGTFTSVMQGTRLLGLDGEVYVVQVPTSLAKEWLDNRLLPVVERALSSVIGASVKVVFRL